MPLSLLAYMTTFGVFSQKKGNRHKMLKSSRACKHLKLVLILPLCVFTMAAAYAQDGSGLDTAVSPVPAWDDRTSRNWGEFVRDSTIALGYCLFKNTILMYFNGVILQSSWAFPTTDSIMSNFNEPWKWEDADGFMVNHLGHPIQGSVYFNAGRVNGFGFYSSLFFSALGSFSWEAFHERQRASMNDLLITAPTGMSLGEILYRLYVQAHAAGFPALLIGLFNPAAGVHRLVTGWEPPPVQNNFYDIRFYVGAAYAHTDYSVFGAMLEETGFAGTQREVFSHSGAFADVGFHIIYGDPFVQSTWVPFRHFEFFGSFGADVGNQNHFRVFSDGYLFSFSPLYSETQALSHGLSLHFDYATLGEFDMFYATINMYSNALGWSAKYRHLFSEDISWRARMHAAFTFFGASSYHNPLDTRQSELLNYGFGMSVKHLSGFEFGRRNRFDVHNFFYFQWHYPRTAEVSATEHAISQGFVWFQFHDFTFSRLVTERVSLGATFSMAMERGWFGAFPSTRKNHWAVRTFVAWNGNNIRGTGGNPR